MITEITQKKKLHLQIWEQFHNNSQHKIVKKISSSTLHDIIKRSDYLLEMIVSRLHCPIRKCLLKLCHAKQEPYVNMSQT